MSSPSRRDLVRSESWPGIEAARVPSSREYANAPRWSNRSSRTFSSSSSNCRRVSPGKPTMNEVRMATPGTRSRMRPIRSSICACETRRPMRRRMSSFRCWSGRSTYGQSFGSVAVRLDELRREVRRVRVEQPQPAQPRRLGEARQQFVDARRAGPVRAVERRVLPDHVQLARAGGDQLARFLENLLGRAGFGTGRGSPGSRSTRSGCRSRRRSADRPCGAASEEAARALPRCL